MIQDSLIIEKRHKRFIKSVCNTETVYGLKNHKGFATSSSVKYENDNGQPIGIICFWAEKSLAKSCIEKDWHNYKISEILLSDFIENWCVGMENDGLLIGTEFDRNMFGFESEPMELILELITELKSIGKDLKFKKFEGIIDLEKQVHEILA
ncbi:DUF2750 domain-containing protein [Polaribacter sp.]|uniref:DUF2750 domain-containing protein n=1 Tax=Polaribacter sp. TaxID=1920175 RepID=UPI003EF69AC1